MLDAQKIVWIAMGGGIGAVLRYLASGYGQRLWSGPFPTGTLLVNVLGCLLMGVFGAMFAGHHLIREEYRLALLVGVFGAFTTFSTFGWETLSMIDAGQWKLALLNIFLSNSLCLFTLWLGYRLSQRWFVA